MAVAVSGGVGSYSVHAVFVAHAATALASHRRKISSIQTITTRHILAADNAHACNEGAELRALGFIVWPKVLSEGLILALDVAVCGGTIQGRRTEIASLQVAVEHRGVWHGTGAFRSREHALGMCDVREHRSQQDQYGDIKYKIETTFNKA